MGNRRLWAILVSIVMLFAFAMPSTGNLLLTQGASKIPSASPVRNIDTGLNYTTVEAGQANIVEHRVTTVELEKMKGYVGVSEGGNHNLIINGHGTGLSPPTEEEWTQIAAKAMVVENVSRGPGSEPYFSSVDWSTSPWFPPIGDQDGQGSCVSWAVGYYTKTFQEATEHGWNLTGAQWEGVYPIGYPTPDYQDKIISPAFIYHLTNWGIDGGSSFYAAINLVCSIGACSWAEMPWNPSDNTTWPSENAWREATYYRGASTQFEWIYVNPPSGILALKNLIASGNLAQIVVDADQYPNLTSEDVWTLDNYIGGTGHANTIVGYDDNMTYLEDGSWSEGAFKIANSWGVGGWENVSDGCYWISYNAMSQIVQYATFYRDRIGYIPTLTSSFRIEHPLRGDCEITIGMGTHDNPDLSKNFTDYICGGNFSFCPNNIVFDITEFKDVVPNVHGQPFFMRVYDSGTSTTGTILYFAVEDTVSSDYTSSSDPPVTTVNSRSVFADLKFGGWPMFHHDPTRTGYSTSTAPNTNQILWSYTTGGYVDSSPAVADGKVYVGSRDNRTYALNATNGAYIWSYTTGWRVVSSPAVADGKVYIGSWDKNVYALNATNGAYIWGFTTGNVVSSAPAVAYGKVYVSSESCLYALDATTGTLIWSYLTGWLMESSPAVADGMVFIGSYNRRVYALDATTGTLIWSYTTGGAVESSPAVADGVVFIGSQDKNVYALNETTGAKIWNYTTGDIVAWSTAAVAYGMVYVGSCDGRVYALDATTGTLIWSYLTGNTIYSSPAVADGVVFIGSFDSNVYALNSTTGTKIWSYATGGYVISSPAVTGGVVYVGSENGKIYAFGLHDVAVIDVSSSKTVVGQGFSASINVTVANQGGYTEVFNVTAYANVAAIQTETLTLTSQNSTTLTFTWNTTGVAMDNYTISAYAWPVPGETNTADNNFTGGWVIVSLLGDITGPDGWPDGKVDMRDIGLVARNFGQTVPPAPANCDITGPTTGVPDGKIDMREIGLVARHFGETSP